MEIKIGYGEIERFVNKHYSLCIGLSMINEKTIELTYKHSRYLPTVTLHLSIVKVGETHVVFNYSSPMIVGRVIEKIISISRKYLPLDIVSLNPESKEIKVEIQGIEGSQILLSMLSIDDILIEKDDLTITCKLK